MAAEKVEPRGMCPTDLAQALDAIAMAKGLDRNKLRSVSLALWVWDYDIAKTKN